MFTSPVMGVSTTHWKLSEHRCYEFHESTVVMVLDILTTFDSIERVPLCIAC